MYIYFLFWFNIKENRKHYKKMESFFLLYYARLDSIEMDISLIRSSLSFHFVTFEEI